MDEKLMDMDFLNQSGNRDLKILIEYRKAKAKFAQLNIQNCIAFFGSARILSPEIAATEIVKHQHDIEKMNSGFAPPPTSGSHWRRRARRYRPSAVLS